MLIILVLIKTVKTIQQKLVIFAVIAMVSTTSFIFWGNKQAYDINNTTKAQLEKASQMRPLIAKLKRKTAQLEFSLSTDNTQAAKWWELAQLYQLQQNSQQALIALRTAYQLQPDNDTVFIEYVSLQAQFGRRLVRTRYIFTTTSINR